MLPWMQKIVKILLKFDKILTKIWQNFQSHTVQVLAFLRGEAEAWRDPHRALQLLPLLEAAAAPAATQDADK